jgi:site-specific recombinase XerD
MVVTPLRQKMMDDLHLRNYSDRTIKAYLRCVSNFARHFKKSPDELGPPQIREYQLYLVKQKQCSWAVFNQTVCALRFFYNTTLGCKVLSACPRGSSLATPRYLIFHYCLPVGAHFLPSVVAQGVATWLQPTYFIKDL